MVKEWNLLRAVACMFIVLLHSTTNTGSAIGYPSIENYHLYRLLLCFATPTFIVLSEIIIANKYKNNLPSGFFKKRIKFIIAPFISFAIIDAFVVNYLSASEVNINNKIISNLLGNFEGYFILIIFQFYILHYLIIRFKISVEKLLPISIIIMILHLYILYSDIPFVNEYRSELKLPFTAWFGYFTVAFLIGKQYEKISYYLKEYKWLTLIFVFFSVYLVYMTYTAGNTQISSRRIDLFPLSISITFAVIAWGQILPNFKIINLISNYSLGIYLIHWQIQKFIAPYTANFLHSTSTRVIGLFIISMAISIIIIKIISLIPFGTYIVGNTKRKYSNRNIKEI